jgi:hypothetical protein
MTSAAEYCRARQRVRRHVATLPRPARVRIRRELAAGGTGAMLELAAQLRRDGAHEATARQHRQGPRSRQPDAATREREDAAFGRDLGLVLRPSTQAYLERLPIAAGEAVRAMLREDVARHVPRVAGILRFRPKAGDSPEARDAILTALVDPDGTAGSAATQLLEHGPDQRATRRAAAAVLGRTTSEAPDALDHLQGTAMAPPGGDELLARQILDAGRSTRSRR